MVSQAPPGFPTYLFGLAASDYHAASQKSLGGLHLVARATPKYQQRNFPAVSVGTALTVASAIRDRAAGNPVSKLILAELISISPSSSVLSERLVGSRIFGFTTGGKN